MRLGNVYRANLTRGARVTYSVNGKKDGTGVVKVVETSRQEESTAYAD